MRNRAREIGLKIGFLPRGKVNAITDVEGVLVGHSTVVKGDGALRPGSGPVRTGVTAVLPHGGDLFEEKVRATVEVLNGAGELTGAIQIREWGVLESPILLTNTFSVGLVADAVVQYVLERNPRIGISTDVFLPVVGECDDSYLNDIRGRHVRRRHVFDALKTARDGVVEEGAIGAGTGMSAFEFKAGIGTSSRILPEEEGGYTLGCLVVANLGRRQDLMVTGVPLGSELSDVKPRWQGGAGSIIVVLATDAPLSSRQLGRLARRSALGLARVGSFAEHGSGEICVAFSTANRASLSRDAVIEPIEVFSDRYLDVLFRAVVEGVQEAVINSLLMAETIEGRDGHVSPAVPAERAKNVLERHGRLGAI